MKKLVLTLLRRAAYRQILGCARISRAHTLHNRLTGSSVPHRRVDREVSHPATHDTNQPGLRFPSATSHVLLLREGPRSGQKDHRRTGRLHLRRVYRPLQRHNRGRVRHGRSAASSSCVTLWFTRARPRLRAVSFAQGRRRTAHGSRPRSNLHRLC